MSRFTYKAKEGPGKIIDGSVEAENLQSAIGKIIQSGLTPVDVSEAAADEKEPSAQSSKRPRFQLFQRIRMIDVAVFTRQMSDLVEASVPMLRSLQLVHEQTHNPLLKNIVGEMYTFVKDGGSFSDALTQHPNTFSRLYVNMVRTGELGGQLELVLNRLADYLEKEHETRNKVRSSLAYPALILVVGVMTVFVLFTFVIPRISVMFDDLGQELPLPTLILTQIGGFFSQYWLIILAICVVAGIYFNRWVSSDKGSVWFDTFKLKVPLLGNFIKVVEIGRFARTLGTLIESGVAITSALNSVWGTMDNVVLREEIKGVAEEVTSGTSLRAALSRCTFFPEIAVNMISAGEETGRLDKGLYKIADIFEREADQTVKTMLSLLGPLVLVGIVGIVGFIVVAMLLPIFKMNLLI